MTDFRALCAELANELDHYYIGIQGHDRSHPLAAEARTALALPEPQNPTDAELLETAADAVGYEQVPTDETCLSLARAVLARWGCQ